MPPKRRYKSKPSVYKLQVTFCASESRCATDVERLAQLGFISSTASMPMTAFSFRLVEQAHASWKVSPRAIRGYADGLKEYYSRCGWGRGHYTGHPWTFGSNVIDEYRALETCEEDSGDLLAGTVDSFQQVSRVLRANQTREKNSNHDQIVPDTFLGEEEVQAMKAEVEASVRPTKTVSNAAFCICLNGIAYLYAHPPSSYYALAILKHISERLPENARIGVLYDIGCNFKHHIEKRQLLLKPFKRLEFATSVLHAYAHVWSCQVEFNPRLIPNFGLTDGEGFGEQKARIGAEVRQALAWIEDEKTRSTSFQTLWTNMSVARMFLVPERPFCSMFGSTLAGSQRAIPSPRPALSEFRGLHQRLNATGRIVEKAKHHQLPAHNRSGTRGPMKTSGLDSARPAPLARDVQQVRVIQAQMDMSDKTQLAKEVGPFSA
ncbi:BQ5605_C006g04245 [Microbotryum silenes-dioicae]|uniref:BQ5605_C006g04245 protein n=1 Tax=Microbotryum silenes-dioicae TaxID=796604 RepID=A0A2X0M9E1_9BASI|nr:BQ5605_C006g04245 [Microbotryum silenes-dioicae]